MLIYDKPYINFDLFSLTTFDYKESGTNAVCIKDEWNKNKIVH